jgi:hypothetical protein
MKKKNLKPTKKQLWAMKLFWNMLKQEENIFYSKVSKLENSMAANTGIEDIEFFMVENEFVGIGNTSRTLKLIQQEELDKK